MSTSPRFNPVDVLTLHEIRTFIRSQSARGGIVFFALLYVLGSLFAGGMVVLGSIPGGYSWTVWWVPPPGTSPWNYPGLLVVAPWGVVSLPFFATFAMVVVSIGVGFGMTVAFLLAIRLLKRRGEGTAGSTSAGAVAGLTPAMISLVTLGACCSTTAAATAGVGLVAQASGTSTANLLLNNWYLGVFQIAIVWVALIAQELLLIVYAGLFGRPTGSVPTPTPRRLDLGFLGSVALRVLLLAGGVLWSLSMVAEWTTINPATSGVGYWFQWVVQHQVLAGLAISAALFPSGTERVLAAVRARTGVLLPALLLVSGLTLLYSPPPLPAWGLDGFANQVLFSLHGPSSWGAISPGPLGGIALLARWGVEYALLAGFAIAVALRPVRAFTPLNWSGNAPQVAVPPTSPASPDPTRSPQATLGDSAMETARPGLSGPILVTRGP